ncbi:unnamed protein product, partial [Medioppia subpectinata]
MSAEEEVESCEVSAIAGTDEYNSGLTEEEVDELRKSWEIKDHWVLRRDFILQHKSKYPLDRLLCLAQTFVNINVLHNEYDPQLMKLIDELAKDMNCETVFVLIVLTTTGCQLGLSISNRKPTARDPEKSGFVCTDNQLKAVTNGLLEARKCVDEKWAQKFDPISTCCHLSDKYCVYHKLYRVNCTEWTEGGGSRYRQLSDQLKANCTADQCSSNTNKGSGDCVQMLECDPKAVFEPIAVTTPSPSPAVVLNTVSTTKPLSGKSTTTGPPVPSIPSALIVIAF